MSIQIPSIGYLDVDEQGDSQVGERMRVFIRSPHPESKGYARYITVAKILKIIG